MQPFFDRIPKIKWITYENAAHFSHIEQREKFFSQVKSFLENQWVVCMYSLGEDRVDYGKRLGASYDFLVAGIVQQYNWDAGASVRTIKKYLSQRFIFNDSSLLESYELF